MWVQVEAFTANYLHNPKRKRSSFVENCLGLRIMMSISLYWPERGIKRILNTTSTAVAYYSSSIDVEFDSRLRKVYERPWMSVSGLLHVSVNIAWHPRHRRKLCKMLWMPKRFFYVLIYIFTRNSSKELSCKMVVNQ